MSLSLEQYTEYMKTKEPDQKIELNIIQNNPYRILGAPVLSSEREIQKLITKSNRFAEVGKTFSCETDFPFLGEFERNTNSVNTAAKNIEQPLNKILYSSFWFLNENHIDNIAFESLQKGDFEKALSIWEKVVGNGEVSDKKFSNLQNLKTLYLGLSVKDISTNIKQKIDHRDFNKKYFFKGIELSGKFINHKDFKSFCKKIVGDKFNFSLEKIENLFLDSILSDIKELMTTNYGPQIIKINEIIDAVGTFSSDTQFKFSQKFSAGETNRIEKEIENSEIQRNKNPDRAYEFGLNLYKKTKEDIKSLSNIIGDSDVKYQMIANKLADELIECAIVFYNKKSNGFTNDVALKAYEICKYAKSITSGGPTAERIDTNLKVIKESSEQGIDTSNLSKTNIIRIEKVCGIIDTRTKVLKEINSKPEALLKITGHLYNKCFDEAEALISKTADILENLEKSLGADDKVYIKICDLIVTYTLALLIEYVNYNAPINGVSKVVLDFTRSFSSYPMEPDTKARYDKNLYTLNGMYNRSNSGSGGCYIATMVYGDYEHPQVKVLREFRDSFLSKHFIGRSFIQFYYKHSPKWVETMKNMKIVNLFIRFILNKIILIIKK